jgi:hypothetical protein
MGYDDRREILERLEALERMLRSRSADRGRRDEGRGRRHRDRGDHHHHHDHHHDHDRRDHDGRDHGDRRREGDEKRMIDTIVHLVTEQMSRMMQDREAHSRERNGGDDEKRIVDLIVGLVSEHVREIVAEELDRRLGRPAGETSGPPSRGESESE